MFAIEPLPSVLHDLVDHYQYVTKNYAYALSLACFLGTQCHPYEHPAPFNPWRLNGVVLIANLLSRTAPRTAKGELAMTCPHKGLVTVLENCDQACMCEAMLRIVVHYGPMAHSESSGVLISSRELLDDIESLPGREMEKILLQTWITDHQNPGGKYFFENSILKPLKDIAAFAIEIASAELDRR
jgi:hypothetical protein